MGTQMIMQCKLSVIDSDQIGERVECSLKHVLLHILQFMIKVLEKNRKGNKQINRAC